jgi:two-component system sensor histidine kinase KdpD
MERDAEARPRAEELLRELGLGARLTVYIASAPGAGKTRRLLEEARALQHSGIDVAVGWIDLKGRADLEPILDGLRVIPPRTIESGCATFQDFDFEAALAAHPTAIILDELAHTNLPGGRNGKRWQDALALREAGITVIGALNVLHVETVAPVAERAIGFPIREIVPLSFLQAADQVVALDAPPDLIEARLRSGKIVAQDDVERALAGSFKPQTLQILRELMLRTLDELTDPVLRPVKVSALLALPIGLDDPAVFLRKCAALADASDLSFEVPRSSEAGEKNEKAARNANARVVPPLPLSHGLPDWTNAGATIVALPQGEVAKTIASAGIDRHVYIADPSALHVYGTGTELRARHPYAQTAGDRLRIGYGRFTVYLGASAGCGKTYAMLDRAHQMKTAGVDLVAALVETHGRPDTVRMLDGLEVLPRKNGELDREALMTRRPQVALIDELAHTNAAGSDYPKRYQEVLSIVRSGISVVTTLNVQHLEGLSDAVLRLTGQRVRETLPDGILELADDVVLIDATPEVLRERLRAGKIYPAERIDRALSNFFTLENLTALRELAIRETIRARQPTRLPAPFAHIVVGVRARERDAELIRWTARFASRLDVELTVVHVAATQEAANAADVQALRSAAKSVGAQWRFEVDPNPATALVRVSRQIEDAAIVVEGARGKRRFWQPAAFARRVIDAGAGDVVLYSPAPFAAAKT